MKRKVLAMALPHAVKGGEHFIQRFERPTSLI